MARAHDGMKKRATPHEIPVAPHWVDSGSVHVLHLAAAP